jgi:hypothetical protein
LSFIGKVFRDLLSTAFIAGTLYSGETKLYLNPVFCITLVYILAVDTSE